MQTVAKPFVVLKHAVGTIQADDSQQERLEEFTERITAGEFHKPTNARIVCDCVDGRHGATGELMPNAAGGSETIMVADDLTTKSFQLNDDDSTVAQYKVAISFLSDRHMPVGGHTCEGVPRGASGCAANDLLPAIYSYIAQHGEIVRSAVQQIFGIKVDDSTHLLITNNAAARDSFSSGADLLQALQHQEGAHISKLLGSHREVLIAVNMRPNTTLDRDAVHKEFEGDYQAFNIDFWAFRESAELSSYFGGSQEVERKIAAMAYYNLAVKHVIGGKNLRIVIVK
jgi:hypothetical protein